MFSQHKKDENVISGIALIDHGFSPSSIKIIINLGIDGSPINLQHWEKRVMIK
jgi:hypothetical protein